MIRQNSSDGSDRRVHPRHPSGSSVTVRNVDGRLIRGRLLNVSAGGALVELDYNDDHAETDQQVALLIESDGKDVAAFARFQTLRGTIRYLRDERHVGVEFAKPRYELGG